MTRLPALGSRGEGWVVAQGLILVLVAVTGLFGPAWDGPARAVGVLLGAALIVTGASLVVRGSRDLGAALTPLPRPREEAMLIESGVYARVRHPIYGGIVIASVGWGLMTASIPTLLLALVTWAFFTVKSMREEAWLVERFPDYPAYRAHTRRLIPWIG